MNDLGNDNANEAALIVFGRPNEARAPKAAWFSAEIAETARAAATEMNFFVIEVKSDEARAILKDILEGRFSVNGRPQIPTVPASLYESLTELYARQNLAESEPATALASEIPAEPHAEFASIADVARELEALSQPVGSTDRSPNPSDDATKAESSASAGVCESSGLSPDVIVPAILVFGRSGLGRARAGWFTRIEAALARKAAETQGFRWIAVETKEQHLAAAQLSHGRLSGKGILALPTILMSTFELLNRLALRTSDPATIFYEAPRAQSQPTNWDEVRVGNVVLAVDDDSGWWEAIVLNRMGEELALAWQVEPEKPVFTRSIFEIALPHPNSDPVTPSGI